MRPPRPDAQLPSHIHRRGDALGLSVAASAVKPGPHCRKGLTRGRLTLVFPGLCSVQRRRRCDQTGKDGGELAEGGRVGLTDPDLELNSSHGRNGLERSAELLR